MRFKNILRKSTEVGLAVAAITALILAGCGGSKSTAASPVASAVVVNTSAVIVPFKGPYVQGAPVILRDAMGASIATATVGVNGQATITFPQTVSYPLSVEVSGTYWNEVTKVYETSATPLRGLIVSPAVTQVPVTIVTEAAVADLETKKTISMNGAHAAITTAEATAALIAMGTNFGVAANTVPSFSGNTSVDPNTISLAALAVVANGQAGATLADKVKALTHNMVIMPVTGTPTALIPQATMAAAMTVAAGNMTAVGGIAPIVVAPTISVATMAATQAAAATAASNAPVVTVGSAALSSYFNDAKTTGLAWWQVYLNASGVGSAMAGIDIFTQNSSTSTTYTVNPRVIKSMTVPGGAWGANNPAPVAGSVVYITYDLTATGWVARPATGTTQSSTVVDNGNAASFSSTGWNTTAAITKSDLAGKPVVCNGINVNSTIGDNLSGFGATVPCPIATTYPAGSALYSVGETLIADSYIVWDQTGVGAIATVVTDGAGVALTALPAVGSTFCVSQQGLIQVYAPIVGAVAGGDNYKLLSSVSCAAADINTALAAPAVAGGATALLAIKASGLAGVSVVTIKKATSFGTSILALNNGKWMPGGGYFAGEFAGTNYWLNKTATNTQLVAHGLPALP